jgi:hypothetical protein
MKKYGLVKLEEFEGKSILVTWNENFVNRFINNNTNTFYTKPVKDMVTGVVIKPDPFAFWDGESIDIKEPNSLTYVTYPHELTIEEAKQHLEELKSNPEELASYIEYLSSKLEAVKQRRHK